MSRFLRPGYQGLDAYTPGEQPQVKDLIKLNTNESPYPPSPLAVQAQVEKQLEALPRREIARASVEQNGKIILVENLEEAVALANHFAPEHLELCVEDPFALLGGVRNAGSVFLGRNAPEALGDYWAGLNHTLPTSGTARFSSPLSVDDFVKTSQFVYYTRDALSQAAKQIQAFARQEGLEGHARSIGARFGEVEG